MARRCGWYQVKGRWARTLGERGYRVRLFQITKGGSFYRTVWINGQGIHRISLGTVDRTEAERLGRALLASLISGQHVAPQPKITLGELWDRYHRNCATFLDNGEYTRREATRKADVLMAYFGKDCVVDELTADDQAAYATARRAGGLKLSDGKVTRPVRARPVESDLALLHAMLRWATTVRVNGVRLLAANPLAGVKRVKEANPRRPVATWERFTATREEMQKAVSQAETEVERHLWVRMEFALVLAEATGRRLGSIRQLRWEDIDLERRTIHWRADADKKGKDWVIPMPDALVEEVRRVRRALAVVGGWVFPAEQNPDRPMDRFYFDKWLRRAEDNAKLLPLLGGLWHPYRRKWATERKHLSTVDVAAAGGWKDTSTLMTCYQTATNDAMLAVMQEPTKLRDRATVLRSAEG